MCFSPLKSYLHSHRASGFTLVEVVLALGIVSSAMIPLVGMLYIGMQTLRESIDQTVTAQILQRVSSDAQLTDFDRLESYMLHFDDQGAVQIASHPQAIYEVNVQILPDMVALPQTHSSSNLRNAEVTIKNRTSGQAPSTHTLVMANLRSGLGSATATASSTFP